MMVMIERKDMGKLAIHSAYIPATKRRNGNVVSLVRSINNFTIAKKMLWYCSSKQFPMLNGESHSQLSWSGSHSHEGRSVVRILVVNVYKDVTVSFLIINIVYSMKPNSCKVFIV